MTPTLQPPQNPGVDQERARVAKLLEEVAQLSEQDIAPAAFYGELLKKLLAALLAPSGAVWMLTTQGNASPLCQTNLKEVGLDERPEAQGKMQVRAAMIQAAFSMAKPVHVMPNTLIGQPEEGRSPGNPTDHVLLIVPLFADGQVQGLIEVYQRPNRPPNAIPGFLQFMGLLAELSTRYQRNRKMSQLIGQQQTWLQFELFARQVHGSLNPVEVAYLVANEGRRLIVCDRVCVALRYGTNVKVEAVSGSDVVETRSNEVQLLRTLCDGVLNWGEKLVFTGVRDDGLPPKLLEALDEYLAARPTRLLVIQPLMDERQKDTKQLARAVVVMECFNPTEDVDQFLGRLENVSRHATPALYNAIEHRRIPMRFLWMPLASLQEGLGGKTRALVVLVAILLAAIGSALWFVPYPLKMDATGQLIPAVQRKIYPPVTGIVEKFFVAPGEVVLPDQLLAQMYDKQLADTINKARAELESAQARKAEAENQHKAAASNPEQQQKYRSEAEQQALIVLSKQRDLANIQTRYGADPHIPGRFYLHAPKFTPEQDPQFPPDLQARPQFRYWTVLSSGFTAEWNNREAKPSDALVTLAAKDATHELELHIPQKHIGQILAAYDRLNVTSLDVDFLLRTHPTTSFRGKLSRSRISGQVSMNKEDGAEAEPFVMAFVEIEGKDIDEAYRLAPDLMRTGTVAGTEVHAKVRCGPAKLGYALFYGIWEFLYERVVFFF